MDTTEAEAYVEAMLSFTNAKRALSGTASSAKALTRNQMVEERLFGAYDVMMEKLRDEREKAEKQVEALRSIHSQPVERTTSINARD